MKLSKVIKKFIKFIKNNNLILTNCFSTTITEEEEKELIDFINKQ